MYVGEAQAAKQREKTSGLWLKVQTAARHRGGYRQTVVLRSPVLPAPQGLEDDLQV